MYSSVRRIAMFSFVMSIFTVVAALLLLIHFSTYADFTLRFTWCLYVISASAGFLFVSWGLFNISKDLEREYSANSEYMHKLNQRIKHLEDRTQ